MKKLTPEQFAVLKEACDHSSQVKISAKIGISTAVISKVLAGDYNHDQTRLATAIEAHLMISHVQCPVLEEISLNICLREQKIGLAGTNPLRVQLWRACRSGCQYYKGKETCQ